MTGPVFVDTNIFVYARDTSEPAKQPTAVEWIQRLWIEQRGRTSIQVLCEYYAVVTRKLEPGLSRDAAWSDVSALLAWEPRQTDGEIMNGARELERRYSLSWWDALVVASALAQRSAVLLTEDLQHGFTCEGLVVRNPFIDTIGEEPVRYAGPERPVSRHRGRGRPPRAREGAS